MCMCYADCLFGAVVVWWYGLLQGLATSSSEQHAQGLLSCAVRLVCLRLYISSASVRSF
jgi:hypothetical protein